MAYAGIKNALNVKKFAQEILNIKKPLVVVTTKQIVSDCLKNCVQGDWLILMNTEPKWLHIWPVGALCTAGSQGLSMGCPIDSWKTTDFPMVTERQLQSC
jgi:hypothetical protein